MSSGRRWLLFGLLLLVSAGVAGAAMLSAVRSSDRAAASSPGARGALDGARTERRPVVVFRSLRGERAATGQVAVANLAAPAGRRTLGALRCDRVYFAGGNGLCLAAGRGFAAGYEAQVFGPDLRVRRSVSVAGVPSRARVSPDGRYGSVTLFVTGHSYADAGSFSTQTTLIDMRRGRRIADLEDFVITRAGRRVTALDVNLWGVTFARNSDRFYATMATGGETYLIEGSVRGRSARVLHENVECPSLSPDETRVAYKRRTGSSKRPWRAAVLDLATMRETILAEPRSIDDQIEWLNDDHVLYGVDGEIVTARADGGGRPRRYLAEGDSPAVVRW